MSRLLISNFFHRIHLNGSMAKAISALVSIILLVGAERAAEYRKHLRGHAVNHTVAYTPAPANISTNAMAKPAHYHSYAD
jgi:hypothetical protein